MNEVHIMIDIETLSTQTDAMVLSIGAIKFDPETGEHLGQFYAEPSLAQQAHRHISTDTIKWWFGRVADDGKQASIFTERDEKSLAYTMSDLGSFIKKENTTPIIWANDPDFDCAILSSLFFECGIERPWAYHNTRSVRTIRHINKQFLGDTYRPTVRHEALADCADQIQTVTKVWSKLHKLEE